MQHSSNETEIWKSVPGWEGRYEASSLGRVRSLPRQVVGKTGRKVNLRGKVMDAKPGPNGYILLSLCKGGKKKPEYAHRMVAMAFHGLPSPGSVTRHLDGSRDNNRPENLAWGTEWENSQDMLAHGRSHGLNKEHCPRGHILQKPNIPPFLVKRGKRECWSCRRARAAMLLVGNEETMQEASDRFYREIMATPNTEWGNDDRL